MQYDNNYSPESGAPTCNKEQPSCDINNLVGHIRCKMRTLNINNRVPGAVYTQRKHMQELTRLANLMKRELRKNNISEPEKRHDSKKKGRDDPAGEERDDSAGEEQDDSAGEERDVQAPQHTKVTPEVRVASQVRGRMRDLSQNASTDRQKTKVDNFTKKLKHLHDEIGQDIIKLKQNTNKWHDVLATDATRQPPCTRRVHARR